MTTIRTALYLLGAALLLCIGGIITLAALEVDVPEVLNVTAGTCVGAIGALLTRVPAAASGDERSPADRSA